MKIVTTQQAVLDIILEYWENPPGEVRKYVQRT